MQFSVTEGVWLLKNLQICATSFMDDPLNHFFCRWFRSSAVSGAGEGLFAARDLPAGTIAAFYNGVRLPYVLGGPKEIWETSGYKIYVNADFKSGERMDIPVSDWPIFV